MLALKINTTPRYWNSASYRTRCHAHPSNSASPITQPTSLLQWLVTTQGASPSNLKAERAYRGEDLGWGLVATQNILPDEAILSVPLSSAITSEGASEDEWSIHMAGKILHAINEGVNSPLKPWLDSLPTNINLPWLYWSPEEVASLQDPDTIAEAYNLRTVFDRAIQKYCINTNNNSDTPEYRPAEVAYALSLVHSRSFLNSGIHVWVPGVDLCNHNGNNNDINGINNSANASVRCTYNPDVCQGAAATEEIAPPEVNCLPRPSVFELVAGERGISKGEEVTISYGKWPNDVFLLFFGFIPKGNDNDSVVLFQNLTEIFEFISELVSEGTGVELEIFSDNDDTSTGEEGAVLGEEEEKTPEWYTELKNELVGGKSSTVDLNEFSRMVLTPSGIDYRLIEGVTASLKVFVSTYSDVIYSKSGDKAGDSEFLQVLSVPILIAARCHQILAGFPTTLEEDEKAILSARGNYKTALEYRIGKKRILRSALAYFELQSG